MTTDTQKQGGESTHTVKSGDGTAGATSRQTTRTSRGTGRPKSGSGHATSTSTTRSGPPARSGGKHGGKPSGKPGAKSGAKQGGKPGAKPGNKTGTKAGTASSGKNQTKNPRGARTGNRHPRGGQRMRTVLETSAGGLVVRGLAQAGAVEPEPDLSRLEVALIGRLDRRGRMLWSMPKGHIEPGETIEETARREALEETGADSTVLGPLGIIDYWFVAEGRRIHKTVHHHLMRYDHGELCDEDPEITEVAWVAFDDLPRRLAYPDERRLVEKARTLLPEIARAELAGRNPAPAAAQQVDPSRRADGPAPVRRTGQGSSAGRNVTAGQGNSTAKPGASPRATPRARHRDDAPEESTS